MCNMQKGGICDMKDKLKTGPITYKTCHMTFGIRIKSELNPILVTIGNTVMQCKYLSVAQ